MHMKETIEMGTLTKKELEMMNVLWQSETALTASEILKASTNRTWKDKSLHILINSLLKKNLIVVDGFKKWRKYTPDLLNRLYLRLTTFGPI